MESELGRLIATARMGLKVVPFMMHHNEHGECRVELDGDGIKVTALSGKWEKHCTWEKFDNLNNK